MDTRTCWFAYATTVSLAIIAFLLLSRHLRRRKLNLPPRPKHWLIIGNLNLIGSLHRYIHYLSQKYGPFMQLKFRSFPVLVGFSGDMAKAELKTHDLTFVNLPNTASGKYTDCAKAQLVWIHYFSYLEMSSLLYWVKGPPGWIEYFWVLGFLENTLLGQVGWIQYFLVLEILLLLYWAKVQLGWISSLAVRSNLGGAKVKICGHVQHLNVFGGAIGYTIASFICMINLQEIFNPLGFQFSGNKGKMKPKLFLLLFMVLLNQAIFAAGRLEPNSTGNYTDIGTRTRFPIRGPNNPYNSTGNYTDIGN